MSRKRSKMEPSLEEDHEEGDDGLPEHKRQRVDGREVERGGWRAKTTSRSTEPQVLDEAQLQILRRVTDGKPLHMQLSNLAHHGVAQREQVRELVEALEGAKQRSHASLTTMASVGVQLHVDVRRLGGLVVSELERSGGTRVAVPVLQTLARALPVHGLGALGVDTSQLMTLVVSNLHSKHARVRQGVLRMLHCFEPDLRLDSLLQTTVASSLQDSDARVRLQALRTLRTLQLQRKSNLRMGWYPRFAELLQDEAAIVREAALRNMHALALLYPDLLNDTFTMVCRMATDPSAEVRVTACRTLGVLHGVDESFLLQAFSKKTTKMRLRGIDKQDIRKTGTLMVPQGEREIAEGGREEEDTTHNDAAGAFVHGLEDEFYQVRMATIDSMCELSIHSRKFSLRAIESLIDMLNDEIDLVRLEAVNGLRRVASNSQVQLKQEQIGVVLALLQDRDRDIRRAVRALLSTTDVINLDSLYISVQELLNNITRYGEDKTDVYMTLRRLGLRHAHFVEILVEELLRLDPRFESVEATVDDVYYVSILIIVFNAAVGNPNILSLLPEYAFRHYAYLQTEMGQMFHAAAFPSIGGTTLHAWGEDGGMGSEGGRVQEAEPEWYAEQVYACCDKGYEAAVAEEVTVAELRDKVARMDKQLSRCAQLVPRLAGSAAFVRMYLELLVMQVQLAHSHFVDDAQRVALEGKLRGHTRDMCSRFVGLPPSKRKQLQALSAKSGLLRLDIDGCVVKEYAAEWNGQVERQHGMAHVRALVHHVPRAGMLHFCIGEEAVRVGVHASEYRRVTAHTWELDKRLFSEDGSEVTEIRLCVGDSELVHCP